VGPGARWRTRMVIRARFRLLSAIALLVLATPATALAESRLMRQPDIHGNQVTFVYGGDLWTVDRTGGAARKLTNDIGLETFPSFSPDGKTIAFTGEYDGNVDAFTIPATGGEPLRLTFHPGSDRVVTWYPDGSGILFRTGRGSYTYRIEQFYKVSREGGFAEGVVLPVAGPGTFSPDGKKLAYNLPSMESRTWKRYQGGSAPEIYIYDFKANDTKKITDWTGTDEFPMWYGKTIYFNSDRTGKLNIYAYDLESGSTRQVTKFDDFDVKWPSLGPDAIVFENGGYLHVLDLPSEKLNKIAVNIEADRVLARSEFRNVSDNIRGIDISPSAKRVVMEARGDIFTAPAKKGTYRNLTNTPAIRERDPAWSPDGRWVAYWSDRSGEYELFVKSQDGKGDERQITHLGKGYGFTPIWSPDSKKLLYSDQSGTVFYVPVNGGDVVRVDKSDQGDIRDYKWSPDSKWIAYSKTGDNLYNSLYLYSLGTKKVLRLSDGMTDDIEPAFDPEGKYLFFRSNRHFNPQFGAYDNEFIFPNSGGLFVMTLAADTPSPILPESDEEEAGEAGKDKQDDKDGDEGKAAKKDKDDDDEEKADDTKVADITVDADGIATRIAEIPVDPGNYFGLSASKGKLFYLDAKDRSPYDDDDEQGGEFALRFFDFEEREEETVLDDVNGYGLNKDGSKILVSLGKGHAIIDAKADQKVEDKLALDNIQMMVDPKAEWHQMFADAWRLERDFFYDPSMHGVDWKGIRERYEPLVDHVSHRTDLNYLLGELIGELNCSHAYVGGGDFPKVPKVGVGLLGADYELDRSSGRYRFQKIYRQSEWNQDVAAPLAAPGVQVKEGDYLISVNGQEVKAPTDVYAYFQNTAGRPITIQVNSKPSVDGAREYTVDPAKSEGELRYTEWVSENRRKVAEATGGRVGYLHVPDTAIRGHVEFSKGFYASVDKDGLIVDGRFNSGGFIPDEMVARLARKQLSYWARREYKPFKTPTLAVDGPKAVVTNEYAGSGGDCLPYFFRAYGLGPVIGKRTWGGLVGISRSIPLMDGGGVTFPDFGFYSLDGQWVVENHGVDMDIEVEQWPHLVVNGHDPQLERAIQEVMKALETSPPRRPVVPPYPNKAGVKIEPEKTSREN
jgi:tricorn protease